MPATSINFEDFIDKATSVCSQRILFINVNNAFFSLKKSRSPGYNDVYFNVTRKCYGELCEQLRYFLIYLSVNGLKIAKIIPKIKAGNTVIVGNYRSISVLPCILKFLERIMYNCLYKYLKNENIL